MTARPADNSTAGPVASRVLLIDGFSIAFRAFYALPVENFTTSTGQPTNAVYGFMSMLIGLLRDEQPSHVGVAWDASRVSFRTSQYGDYKATRGETPAPFIGQSDLIREVLTALAIPSLELADYEADDILATWATEASQLSDEVLVCSGDRDTFQLVNDRVTVLYPRRGTSDLARMTPAAVLEKYGVPPARYPELAALVGETADNLPGVPGVGPKTAAKWLTQFDGLANLLARADEVTGKAGQSLRDHRAAVERNRQLNALVTDLDLPVTIADLGRRPWDQAAVQEIFETLEFRTLRSRLAEIGPSTDSQTQTSSPAEPSQPLATVVLEPGTVAAWLAEHAQPVDQAEANSPTVEVDAPPPDRVGLMAVGGPAGVAADLVGLALAAPDQTAAWIDVGRLSPDDDQALAAWLGNPAVNKVGHAWKEPLRGLWNRGWELAGLSRETELAAYLIQPDRRRYDLADLASQYLGRDLTSATVEPQPTLDFADTDETVDTAAAMNQAAAVRDLSYALDDDLATRGGASQLLVDVELPVERILARMEATGIAADRELFQQIWSDLDQRVQQAEQAAYQAIGRPVNLGSPKQLQEVLFDQLQMPKTRRLKTGYTTDAESLIQLSVKQPHPFLDQLLAYRENIKLRQSVEGLMKAIADDGRIHTTYLQTVAATGRLSSADPNLQNIPVRTAASRQIRQAFVAGVGFDGLLTADYSQIEMRIMADLSGDQQLIEAFQSGEDFHAVMAAHVFGLKPDSVSPAQRSRIKAMNYGLAYGLSAYGLSSQLQIPVNEARVLMDDYFTVFGSVRDYLQQLVAQARQTGYTETIMGRRRYLPDLNS
ncbi:MAG: DNA polymerase I, partial [Propionibacteriaceae bacterium]|nr:DNA polymerase I [Propionibacteriaceae bacterium]